jgi:hypothetical protein
LYALAVKPGNKVLVETVQVEGSVVTYSLPVIVRLIGVGVGVGVGVAVGIGVGVGVGVGIGVLVKPMSITTLPVARPCEVQFALVVPEPSVQFALVSRTQTAVNVYDELLKVPEFNSLVKTVALLTPVIV